MKHLRPALVLCLYLAAATSLYPGYFEMPVSINGDDVFLAGSLTLGEALVETGLPATRGDLLDVDGRVLRRGAGGPVKVLLNGRPAAPDTVLARGDRILTPRTGTATETVKQLVEAVAPPVRAFGSGRFTIAHQLGRPGRRVVTVGTFSGKLVSARIVQATVPSIVERTDVPPSKMIALTFDDGPSASTQGIMETLRRLQVPATFFIVGRQAQRYPYLVRALAVNGFSLANHSWTHFRLDGAPAEAVMAELDTTRALIAQASGATTVWFRPPFGRSSPLMTQIAEQRGFRIITWDVDSEDWRAPDPGFIVQRVVGTAHPNAIVLMHDGGGNRMMTEQALPGLVDALRGQGYTFVTLDQMFPAN